MEMIDRSQVLADRGGRSGRGSPQDVARHYLESSAQVKASMLEKLLLPVGPLALLVISNGAFRPFFYRLRSRTMPISPEDAQRVDAADVLELAIYLEQSNPAVLASLAARGMEGYLADSRSL